MGKIEKIITVKNSRCINIAGSRVESLRINSDMENTVRVYEDGFIGVEGKIGNADFNELETKAKANLAQKITYPETHDAVLNMETDCTKDIIGDDKFVAEITDLTETLARQNPEFIFSNKVLINSLERTYVNSDGTRLVYKGNDFEAGLTIKRKGSASIMDEFYSAESGCFDKEAAAADVKLKCDAFLRDVGRIEEDEVTVIADLSVVYHIVNHFAAELYCNNASLLSGKLGKKIFSDNFGLVIDRNPKNNLKLPYFDSEGVVNDGYSSFLVEKGVLKKLLTTKKTAAEYGLENTGSAGAAYTSVPSLGIGGLDITETHGSLSDIIGNGKAVYLSVSEGGDVTPSGDLSMPSQVSYLYENGTLVGKLPEFTVTGNIFRIFGGDFLGFTKKGFFRFGRQNYLVFRAKLVNKA